MFTVLRRVTGIRRTVALRRTGGRGAAGAPRAVVVPIVRVDAAALAALGAARDLGGRAIAVHVTRPGERAVRDALVDAWDAAGVDAPLSVVFDERDRLVEVLATFVRGLPERRVAVLVPAAADPARVRGRRHDTLVEALRAEGCAVLVARAEAPAPPLPVRDPLVTAA
ncbi:hypothetical protein [Embleya sp. MST-111070]|uniref:hypothetical protein n=1 Tax=Embleya sp. MST-111070 TaxID=3398231 RepID=UPI003F73ACE6